MKELADEFLNAKIQQGHHSSIIDARVALALYRTFQLYIERETPNSLFDGAAAGFGGEKAMIGQAVQHLPLYQASKEAAMQIAS